MKYIIDVLDEAIEFMGGHISIFVEPVFNTGDCKRYALRLSKEDIEPYTKPDRKAIEDEVWATAIKIDIASEGWDWQEMTYREAKAKYDAWRAERDEIRVGDEVEEKTALWTGVVVSFDEFDNLTIMDSSGKSCDGYKTRFFRKTGRHFPEIADVLKKMGDEK